MSKIPKWKRELAKLAREAKDKPAKLGPDIDIQEFESSTPGQEVLSNLTELPEEVQKSAETVGISPQERERSGSFFQYDQSVILACAHKETPEVEVCSTSEALKKYDWLRDYWWKVVPVDMDKYTAFAETNQHHGYFIRSKPGARSIFPVQACLFMGTQRSIQCPHNIIIAEENSELHIITGCTTHPSIDSGLHIGVSEFYIKEGATLTFTMIHRWGRDFEVRPRTGAMIEKGGTFLSTYICFKPAKTLQMYPVVHCVGEKSTVRFHTLLHGMGDSLLDVGSRAILKAKGSRAEVTARAIGEGSSRIIARGHLVGEMPETKAHLDCRGLLLSETALIHAIPELEGRVEGTDLSHEATVGKIEEEQLYYLMSRGLNEEEATGLIIKGFLDPEVPGLPERLRMEIKKAVQLTTEKAL